MNLSMSPTRWQRLRQVAADVHKNVDIWFSYLVATSVTLQASWSELDEYVPPKFRHWVIGTATCLVVADRIIKSVRATRQPE